MSVPNIVLYANCQSKGIKVLLSQIVDANYEEIANYVYIKEKLDLPIEILKSADIFIYQPLATKHGIYSTDMSIENSICTYLSPHCKKISFPYMYNSGLWPFLPSTDNYIDEFCAIRDLKSKGYTVEQVLKLFDEDKIKFNYEERFQKCMNIMKEKEEKCDVKVTQFIEENITTMKMFLTQNHPSTNLFIHCINQILRLMNIENVIHHRIDYNINLAELPGNYPQSIYDLNFWKFEYDVVCWNLWWKTKIKEVYNSIKD
jgi:hypothetical protein